MTVTAYSLACLALLVVSYACTHPAWKKWSRRRRVTRAHHARLAEDRAWAGHRQDEAALAARLTLDRWAHEGSYEREKERGGHSLRAIHGHAGEQLLGLYTRDELLGLGEIDGGDA